MASMYAVYHGPAGLKAIAGKIHRSAVLLENELLKLGITQTNRHFFDTLKIDLGEGSAGLIDKIRSNAEKSRMNFNYIGGRHICISSTRRPGPGTSDIVRVFSLSGD
jgi:glycine dehydrogenase